MAVRSSRTFRSFSSSIRSPARITSLALLYLPVWIVLAMKFSKYEPRATDVVFIKFKFPQSYQYLVILQISNAVFKPVWVLYIYRSITDKSVKRGIYGHLSIIHTSTNLNISGLSIFACISSAKNWWQNLNVAEVTPRGGRCSAFQTRRQLRVWNFCVYAYRW